MISVCSGAEVKTLRSGAVRTYMSIRSCVGSTLVVMDQVGADRAPCYKVQQTFGRLRKRCKLGQQSSA